MDDQFPERTSPNPDPDFSRAPAAPQTQPSVEPQTSEASSAPEPVYVPEAAATPSVVLPPTRRGGKAKKFLLFLLILLLVGAVGAGAYYYQQQQINTQTANVAQLKAKISSLAAELQSKQTTKKPAAPTPASPSPVLNGPVDSTTTPGKVALQTAFLPGQVSEIWLEYGSSDTSFTKATEHVSSGLGQGSDGEYTFQPWTVDSSQFTAGGTYFYRSAAKVNGATVYSGVTAFVMP